MNKPDSSFFYFHSFKSVSIKCIAAFFLLTGYSLNAQTYSSSNPGNFGIDGDVYTDTVLNGTFTAAGSHDWFSKAGSKGISVFDTVGTSYARQQISSGANFGFSKNMQFPRYSTIGGDLYLDAVYTRDYIGNGSQLDYTAFNTTSTNNSAMDPTNWTTMTTGSSSIPGKVDIIDTYIHMRRLSSSSNHVIAYLGASTNATTGNRFFDFEFYKAQVGYDSLAGKFINSGPSATGGHSAWNFNADGSINTFGDLTLSFSFSSSAVSSVDIYIWVPYTTYSTVVPSAFDFTSGSWVGLSNNSGYGYAHIQAKAGATLQAWGMVNTAKVTGPPWAGSYSAGQFAEAAIDLTSLGIDPLIAISADPCAPPYTRVLVKSRSSSSFSAALQDFVGPIVFLNSSPLAAISPASPFLTCSKTSLTLQPAVLSTTTSYTWATTSGSITTRTDSTAAVINKVGKYYLSAHSANCNSTTTDSVIVQQDLNKPVASADYLGTLTTDPNSYVTLKGGDTTASNYSTPYGGSQGLLWNWTGPNGFASSLQNPTAKDSGLYVLTVTEQRNGCTATASTRVIYSTALQLEAVSLKAQYDHYMKNVLLQWKMLETESGYMEVQKSIDGLSFYTLGKLPVESAHTAYQYIDKEDNHSNVYYRIKVVRASITKYSPVVKINSISNTAHPTACFNASRQIVIQYKAPEHERLQIELANSSGVVCSVIHSDANEGLNVITMPYYCLTEGLYFVHIYNGKNSVTIKVR